MKKNIKICFASSSGGHYEQLMMLKPLMEKYNSFIVTEKVKYSIESNYKMYFINQINRKERLLFIKVFRVFLKSFFIFIKEKPNIVISTGALSTIPFCVIAKCFRKKVIFIESFSKVNTQTLTGKMMYKIADLFFVQWEELNEYYPKAIFRGGIY